MGGKDYLQKQGNCWVEHRHDWIYSIQLLGYSIAKKFRGAHAPSQMRSQGARS